MKHLTPLVLSGLLAALLCSSCQSLDGYTPYCQQDDDCQGHQYCDLPTQACLLRSGYDRKCDPLATYDTCGVATSCDAEAMVCLPRPFRAAILYDFDPFEYHTRQNANLLEFLVETISRTFFHELTCEETPPQERESIGLHMRCHDGGRLEFLMVNLSGNAEEQRAQFQGFLHHYPIDVSLPILSTGYHAGVDVIEENQLDILTLGRTNQEPERALQEFEASFTYPSLSARHDFSLIPLTNATLRANYVLNEVGCSAPLVVHTSTPSGQLGKAIYTRDFKRFGQCIDTVEVEEESKRAYPEVMEAIRAQGTDCVVLLTNTAVVTTILSDYQREFLLSPSEEHAPVEWFLQRSALEQSNETTARLREIVTNPDIYEHSHFAATRSLDTPYDVFRDRFEPIYRTFLQDRGCLSLPQTTCDDLNCSSDQPLVQQSCAALSCPLQSHITCLELACLREDPPDFCALLGCAETRSACEYHEPSHFDTTPRSISDPSDLFIITWLLHLMHEATPVSERPLSRDALRDALLSLADPSNPSCMVPDINACTNLLNRREEVHYTGMIRPFVLRPDGRATDSQLAVEFFQVNSNLEFLAPRASYTPLDERRFLDMPVDGTLTCPSP